MSVASADPAVLLQQATVWQQDGKLQQAEEAYRRVLALDPANADALNLLGVTGNIDRFPTVSKLWKYLGLHVVDGHAPKREKGVAWTHTNCTFAHSLTCKPDCKTDHHPSCVPGGIGNAYAPQGRVVCHQIGEAIVKVGGDGPYRRAYDQKKAYYEAERQEWTQARRHNAAMRYAVKELVKALWIEWHTRRGHTLPDIHTVSAATPQATCELAYA